MREDDISFKKFSKLLAILLSITMILTLVPNSVFAEPLPAGQEMPRMRTKTLIRRSGTSRKIRRPESFPRKNWN